ncbi:TPA: beta-hexosaminidase, partial [Enterococcus faecium]|nr:beta-hexosaminidase [Enterococcus faecium]
VAGNRPQAIDLLKQILSAKGFEVEKYISPEEELKGLSQEEKIKNIAGIYAAKRPIKDLTEKYDLIINIANVNPGTVQRIVWPASKGTPDIPFYIHEIPTIFVSVQCPFHLADVPQVKTYINTYDGKQETLEILVDKLMGLSEFKGISPIDAYCGLKDTFI